MKTFCINSLPSLVLACIFFVSTQSNGQGNCLIYPENSGERKACELSYEAIKYPQGSRKSQLLFDSAIATGPKYAYAYYQKSVPFFKHGLLNEGLQILNKAIELEPRNYLCYRAYWYFSHQSYEYCIKDLETYYSKHDGYTAFVPGGEVNMKIIKGICYSKIDSLEKGIIAVEEGIKDNETENLEGTYDYQILGILHFLNNDYLQAETAFKKQLEVNDRYAVSYYYLGLIQKAQSKFPEAKALFYESKIRFEGQKDGFSGNGWGFSVSKNDVVQEIEKLSAGAVN